MIAPADLAEFRQHVRTALTAIASDQRPPTTDASATAAARAEQRRLFDAGLAGVSFPTDAGGAGLTATHERIVNEEARSLRLLSSEILGVSINIVGRTLLTFGDDEQRRRYLPRILSGEEVWVQLLSEPTGGSDLAGLITSATPDGNDYVLNGQKVWSSRAQVADYTLCPVRTNWDVPERDGITVVMVDMALPGIDVRPIKQIDGNEEFCEVFLTDVRVGPDRILGAVDGGWRVVRRWLEFEHSWAGQNNVGRRAPGSVIPLIELAERGGRIADPGVRKSIGELHVDIRAHEALTERLSRAMGEGRLSPAFGGLLKLSSDYLTQRRAALGLSIGGLGAVTWRDEDDARWSQAFLSRGASIGGGTDEIQRNNVGERALGLPREPSPFDGLPFRDVPRN